MPTAGSGRGLRRVCVSIHGRKARRLPQGRRPAGRHGRDESLHSLHALRTLWPRSSRRHGTRHDPPRRAFRNHDGRGRHDRLGTVRQHDRPLPGGRFDQQAVPLQRPHLGTVAPQVDQPARQHRRQPDCSGQGQQGHAGVAARKRRRQRVLARRPRPLVVRGAQRPGSTDHADVEARRRLAGGRLDHRARVRRAWPEGHCCRTRRASHRRPGRAAQHRRRTASAGQAGARPGQRKHRPSPASRRFFSGS